jgi:molecular chaperone DnaK
VNPDLKKQVEDALVEARKHLDSKDVAELQKATEQLTAASNKMAEQMYKHAETQQQAAGGAGNGHANGSSSGDTEQKADGGKKPDDVIDADFKEV